MLLALLFACDDLTSDFGGQEIGEPVDVQLEADAGASDSPNQESDDVCTDDLENRVMLTGGEGTIAVVHEGVEGDCDAEWTVEAFQNGNVITVRYDDNADSDCVCDHTLRYAITDLDATIYTVKVPGDRADVEVD